MRDAAATPSIRTDLRLRAAYSEGAGIYRIVPSGVATPATIEELRELVRHAAASGIALVPRGAGSGIPGNTVGSGVIVDLRERLPRRLEVDPAQAIAISSAGVTQAELNQAAAPHRLRLPPDPSSSRWATLGGMVSTNAAGARSVRYGPVRRWVDALELVTADGEIGWLERGESQPPALTALGRFERDAAPALRAAQPLITARFPRTRKNTAGYALDQWLASGDALDLIVGSEGTLGLVTTIRWRLDHIPPVRSGLRIALASLDNLEPVVQALVALDPSALELLDRTFLDLLNLAGRAESDTSAVSGLPPATEAVLLVEFEGDDPARVRGVTGDAVRAVGSMALDILTALTPDEEQRLWALRHAASPILASMPADRRSLQIVEDGCVPLARLGEYVRAIRDAARDAELTAVIFGHAGDGNVHVNLLPELNRTDWPARVERVYREVSSAVLRLGGTVSGEHGDGRLRAPLLEALYGTEVLELFRRVKTAFDPRGIFNPGVKLDAGGPALGQLKLGPAAEAIPEDIATALREIERGGGYARSRVQIAGAAKP